MPPIRVDFSQQRWLACYLFVIQNWVWDSVIDTQPRSSASLDAGAGAPQKPLTRREALAIERAQQTVAVARQAEAPSRVVAPVPDAAPAVPTASAPFAALAAAPAANAVRPAPAASASTRPARTKRARQPRLGFHVGSALTIVMVALIAVGVSTPAEALMSSADVQAKQIQAAMKNSVAGGQVFLAGGDGQAVDSDRYDSSATSFGSITETENSFTNDPNGTVQWPFAVGVHIGDGYGSTAGRSSAHHGQDFNPGLGAPIQAIANGVVSYAEDGEGDLGVHMMITHVINGQTVTSVYAHMIHGSMRFKVGDTVKVGQVIGNVGNTGYSTGPHLHFEIRLGGIDGPWTDPLVWLRANTN